MESPLPPAGAIAAKGPLKRRGKQVSDDETDSDLYSVHDTETEEESD